MNKRKAVISLAGYEDIFEDSMENGEREEVVRLPISQFHTFRNHPFRVVDDEKMEETVKSVKQYGILMPGIVRPLDTGGYEVIAGHRRWRACELAGLKEMPVLVRNMTDEEATVIMVDTNIQREDILPSEKAKAYKMKYEAMKHQGSKGEKFTADLVGEAAGESGRTVQRYIRLTELIPDLLELVDKKKLQFTVAVEISYIDEKIQQWLYEYIRDNGFIKLKQISALREHLKTEKINQQQMITLLNENMPGRKSVRKVTLSEDRLSKYFPPFYSQDDMEKVLIQLLEIWKQNQTQNDE